MEMVFQSRLAVFSISQNRFLRSCDGKGDLSQLGADEYLSFLLIADNKGKHPFEWKEASISVDGGAPWCWAEGQVLPAHQGSFHVFYPNMKTCMTPGVHRAVWYFDGAAIHEASFLITDQMAWETVFPIPSGAEIQNYRNPRNRRSPYIAAFLDIPAETRYTEYKVDFRATHLPEGTYCCLGCWGMDRSDLERHFEPIRTQGCDAYAGFQKIADGGMVSIMSFWDTYYRDASGKRVTLQAKRLYPQEVIDGGRFGGEGVGERSVAPFDWQAGRWYRMHLKCLPSREGTVVEQWVCDLETQTDTLLCRYETGVAGSSMKGQMALFLENYWTETAGQVRSMEVCNAEYLRADTGQWQSVKQAYVCSQGGSPKYEGSYCFGVSGNRLWMITSGVGGDWFHNGKGKKGTLLTLNDG